MDKAEHQNQYIFTQLITSHQFLKKVTQLLLSLSLFSLLISQYYFKLNYFFSALMPFQVFLTHAINKNCIFLICNGILVLLAKTSMPILSDPNKQSFSNISSTSGGTGSQSLVEMKEYSMMLEKEISLVEGFVSVEKEGLRQSIELIGKESTGSSNLVTEDDKQEDIGNGIVNKGERGEEIAVLVTNCIITEDDEENEDDDQTESCFIIEETEEEEDQEEDGNGSLSTEELNKKFEDFIRKMKEELRIEARRQMVMV